MVTPLWHFLFRGDNYPTAIVLDSTLGNNWSLHATRLPKNALQRQHKYQTIFILPASDRSESTMYSVSGEDFKNGQTHQMARTMELLFPVQQTRANICGIKLMTVKRFSFIWVTFCNGHENCKTFFLQSPFGKDFKMQYNNNRILTFFGVDFLRQMNPFSVGLIGF